MKKTLIIFWIFIFSNNVLAKSINNYDDLDLTSEPKKVLSKSKTKALWNVHKKAKECFEHPTYGEGFGYKLKKQKEDYFIKNEWITPFYKLSDEDKHKISLSRAPKPLEKIKLDENYGEEVAEANFAMNYFQEAAYAGRASNNEENINKIKALLLDVNFLIQMMF